MNNSMPIHFSDDINREILEDTLVTVCQRNHSLLLTVINQYVHTLSDNEVEKWDELVSSNWWDIYEQKCMKRHANPVAQDHNKPIEIVPEFDTPLAEIYGG